MDTGEIITAIVCFALSCALFLLGIRHLMERGFLLNNAWLYAGEKERRAMDKKPFYRQSGIVFCLLGLVFTTVGLSILLQNDGILWAEAALLGETAAYAIASSIRIRGKKPGKPGL